MPSAHLGSPTPYITTHGRRIVVIHKYDWVILLLLIAIDVALNVIDPFYRFVGQDMMADLRFPLKDNTVPFWAVPVIAIGIPLAITFGIYFKNRNVYDLHHALLGLLFSVAITAVITDTIKDGVGRPRPDFFWRCFPDGIAVYDNVTTGAICHGEKSVINEGHKSFPSGHTSWSFAGLGFLSWYIAGKLTVFNRQGRVGKLCVVFLPLLVAALVGVSRVDDYWHHWQDVLTGGLLGLCIASFCYLQFFPLPSDASGFWPHVYYRYISDPHESIHEPSSQRNSHTSRGQGETAPYLSPMGHIELDMTGRDGPSSADKKNSGKSSEDQKWPENSLGAVVSEP